MQNSPKTTTRTTRTVNFNMQTLKMANRQIKSKNRRTLNEINENIEESTLG